MTRRWPWIVWALTLVLLVITFTAERHHGFVLGGSVLPERRVRDDRRLRDDRRVDRQPDRAEPDRVAPDDDRRRVPPRGVHGRIPALRPPARTGRPAVHPLRGVAHELGLHVSSRSRSPGSSCSSPTGSSPRADGSRSRSRSRSSKRSCSSDPSSARDRSTSTSPGPCPTTPPACRRSRASSIRSSPSVASSSWPSDSPRSARWSSGTDGPSGRSASRCAGSSRPSGSRPRC